MQRRDFVKMGVLSAPAVMLGQTAATGSGMAAVGNGAATTGGVAAVKTGTDRMGEAHSLGFSRIFFKTSGSETGGGLFVMEHENLAKGGPFRHVHPAQDEWMYAMAGEFRVEIGEQKITLGPGDSVLMPRKVPHVWAQVGDTPGKLLIAFTPAGNMEAFFREFGKTGKLPTDASVLGQYGLERLGPPLVI
jgi:quercetin dioxygenase-like cupin family protein